MAYVPNYGGVWVNLPLLTTPITAAALSNLETQYAEAVVDLISKSTLDAHSMIMAIADNTPVVLAVAASRIVGRAAAGNIDDLTPAQVMAILSGQAGADFSINTHKITNVVDPGANQDAATKKYVDDNDVDATLELTLLPLGPFSAGTEMTRGYFSVIRLDLATEDCHFAFKIPHDYTAITKAVIVYIPIAGGGSGTVDWTVDSNFAATGETYATHADQVTADGLDTETDANKLKELDISDAFTGILADDHFGCIFELDAVADSGCIDVLYLLFKYS